MQRKNCWYLGLIFLLILLAGIVHGENETISFQYPENISFGETFSISLNLENFSLSTYDIKIDLLNLSGARIARIWNNEEWQSTFNYLNSWINTSLNNQSSFQMNITELYEGEAYFNITIREDSKTWKFGSYSVNVSIPETNQQKPEENQTETDIEIELEYDEEIYNDEEFNVDLDFFNLGNYSYDLKIYLTFNNNDTIISETYNEEEEKWSSSTYYIENFIRGKGNKTGDTILRIDSDYLNFYGEVRIRVKLRKNNETNSIADVEKKIKIIEREIKNDEESINQEQQETQNISEGSSENTIYLNNPKDIKRQESKIYNSKTQYLKEYSIYGFSLFCVLIIILLITRRI